MSKEKTNVVFLKVDVDENEEVAQEYQITCMPTFVFIKDGKKVRGVDFCIMNKNASVCSQ